MMHDKNYHLFKAKIMKPVDGTTLVDKRTSGRSPCCRGCAGFWFTVLWALTAVTAVLLSAGLWFVQPAGVCQLGAEPVLVKAAADAVREGNLTVNIPLSPGDNASVMASMKRMRDYLARVVSDVRANAKP